jgi:hypothetical protein
MINLIGAKAGLSRQAGRAAIDEDAVIERIALKA